MLETIKPKRTLSGVVLSNKMQNTVVVRIETKKKHPLYGKYIVSRTKIHADDRIG